MYSFKIKKLFEKKLNFLSLHYDFQILKGFPIKNSNNNIV